MQETDEKSDKRAAKSVVVRVAEFSELGFLLPACVVIGWLFGALMDRWLHTSWIYLAGIVFGIVVGFIELIRTARSFERKS